MSTLNSSSEIDLLKVTYGDGSETGTSVSVFHPFIQLVFIKHLLFAQCWGEECAQGSTWSLMSCCCMGQSDRHTPNQGRLNLQGGKQGRG